MAIIRCVTESDSVPKLNIDESISELLSLSAIYRSFEEQKLGDILIEELYTILASITVLDAKRNLISKWELFHYIDEKYSSDCIHMASYMKDFFKGVPIIKDAELTSQYRHLLLNNTVLFYVYADSKTTFNICAIYGCETEIDPKTNHSTYRFVGKLPDAKQIRNYRIDSQELGRSYFLTYGAAVKEKTKREHINKLCYASIFNAWLEDIRNAKETDGLLCVHGGLVVGPSYVGFGGCDLHTNLGQGGFVCQKHCADFELRSEQDLWKYFCREYSKYPAYFNAKYGKKEVI